MNLCMRVFLDVMCAERVTGLMSWEYAAPGACMHKAAGLLVLHGAPKSPAMAPHVHLACVAEYQDGV